MPVEAPPSPRAYLLDTDHCSYILDGHPGGCGRYGERKGHTRTCVISQGELVFMAERSQRVEQNRQAVKSFLDDITVHTVDREVAASYGRLKAALLLSHGPKAKAKRRQFKLAKLGLKDNDLWIAAVALHHSLTVVSGDSAFSRMRVAGVLVESWITPSES